MNYSKIKIAVGNDHNGYNYKKIILNYFGSNNSYAITDLGSDNSSDSVDYPDYANLVCEKIESGECEFGILICNTGIGMSMAANRYSQIRAALCVDVKMAEISRQHNNANVLVIGAISVLENDLIDMIVKFLHTKFEGGRHLTRIEKIK